MIPVSKIFLLFFLSYIVIFLTVYYQKSDANSVGDLYSQGKTNALVREHSLTKEKVPEDQTSEPAADNYDFKYQAHKQHDEHRSSATPQQQAEFKKLQQQALRGLGAKSQILNKLQSPNPFKLLDAYPKVTKRIAKNRYNQVHFGLKNEEDYCDRVDRYNLLHPENMFKEKNFFTDYLPWMIVREKVIPQIGEIAMKHIPGPMNRQTFVTPTFPFNTKITNFYVTTDGFYNKHEMGKHFLCPTQMFNHIPGHKSIVRKDEVLKSVERYAKLNEDKPQCFNRDMIFPRAYRLHVEEECINFFNLINSKKYIKSLEKEPIQYLIKIGFGVHKSQGVFLLDDEKTVELNEQYEHGNKCGEFKKSIIAQKYITNPLLLDRNNKFDFRLYMFVASTNPMIAYYHDGYMRVSINEFVKNSKDRATHLTNTYLAEQKFAEAREENKTINGMTADELKDYHLWDFTDLQDYLLSEGQINDPNWLENYLRPAFKKALVHIVRATSYTFWKQSNIHELHGLDFMLDEDLQLWFIECNPNPLLTGVKPELIEKMLLDMFEIQYAYYHSRMKRVLEVIRNMQTALKEKDNVNMAKWKKQYKSAVKNRLEPEFQISQSNTFSLFIDQNLLPSSDAYFGYLDEECIMKTIDKK